MSEGRSISRVRTALQQMNICAFSIIKQKIKPVFPFMFRNFLSGIQTHALFGYMSWPIHRAERKNNYIGTQWIYTAICFTNCCVHLNVLHEWAQVLKKPTDILFDIILCFRETHNVLYWTVGFLCATNQNEFLKYIYWSDSGKFHCSYYIG